VSEIILITIFIQINASLINKIVSEIILITIFIQINASLIRLCLR